MRESLLFSIFIRAAHFMLWVCLSMVFLLPSTDLYAQDSDDVDDVEEYWGDDDEYEDEYDDEDEYLDDDEYEDEDEYEDDEDEYEEDEEDEEDEEELADDAENLGYTIDLALGSPRFTNPVLMEIGRASCRERV